MGLLFHHLDAATRTSMLGEVGLDLAKGTLYLSPRLSPAGRLGFAAALGDAIRDGDDETLAATLTARGYIKPVEESHNKFGMPFLKAVPRDAHVTLAEGEFNRF